MRLFAFNRLSFGANRESASAKPACSGSVKQVRRAALAMMLAAGCSFASQADAVEYVVTSFADSGNGSLREALGFANGNSHSSDTIRFDIGLSGQTISLSSMLPMINKSNGSLTITGLGADQLTISGLNQHRILWVDSGAVVVEGLRLANGNSHGGNGGASNSGGSGGGGLGAGGAIFVNAGGNATLRNVSLANNAAQGGNGGNYSSSAGFNGGGGGGGLSGNGGASGDSGGGGGGGFGGNGGAGSYNAGGGGGGATQNGGAGNFYAGGTAGGSEGGAGGSAYSSGQNGSILGGGGGAGRYEPGGSGGEFGGGGGGGWLSNGGDGGFGSGGGGGTSSQVGQGGYGAGNGGAQGTGGEGGDGAGGAIFVRQGGQITLENVAFSNGSVTGGMGGTGFSNNGANGTGTAEGLFAMDGATTTFLIAQGADMQYDSQNFQADQLVMNSDGTLRIDSNATIGDVEVNSGTLRINAIVNSEVLVNSGGTLGGGGTLSGDLILNGTLAPGNSIGTININGNATLNSGSITNIEINDGGTTPGVNNDAILVNGNVTISGGSVDVDGASGNYTGGSIYTFLTANSITGTFTSISDDLAFFDAFLIYSANSVQFELIANMSDFASVASSSNQLAVASMLDANSLGASTNLQAIIDGLTPLTNQQVQTGLDQFGGAIYGTLPVASLQHTSYYLSQMSGHIKNQMMTGGSSPARQAVIGKSDIEFVSLSRPVDERPINGWIAGYGLGGQAQSDGNADGFRYGIGGTQIAVQRQIYEGHSIGAWSNLSWSNVHGKQLNESADIENYHFGSYLSGYENGHYYIWMGGLGYDHGEVRRQINVGGINASPIGNFDGWQANTYLERGLSLNAGRWNVQPYTALQYVYLRQGEALETGGGILNLATSGLDVHSLRSSLGGRVTQSYRTSRGRWLTPEFRSTWMHEFLDTNYAVGSRFADLGGAGFAVNGVDLGRDWAVVGGGFSFGFGRGSRLFTGYDALFNTSQVLHVGSAGAEFIF